MQTYILPESLKKEIGQLETMINDYKNNKIETGQLKAYRVPFGIYEQRQNDSFMIRIHCAGGLIELKQLKAIADIAERYNNRRIHLTTRQELQIHDLKLEQTPVILRELLNVGLSSRGGGGNTVRNIIADPLSGIHKDTVFDIIPHASALTTRLIAESDSWNMPRKYKIAFSASSADRGRARFSDLGFIATVKNNVKGFTVFACGGLGAHSDTSDLFSEFIPACETYALARALKNILINTETAETNTGHVFVSSKKIWEKTNSLK